MTSSPESSPIPKTSEQLEAQVSDVEMMISSEKKVSLFPPSTEREEIFSMSLEDIKKQFSRRYGIYVELMRANKNKTRNINDDISDSDPVDIPQEKKEDMKKWLVVLNNLDRYIQKHNEGGERTLHDRQFNVFEDLRDFLEQGGKDGYIKLPTGTGKTVLFIEFIEALGMKTLIVVPTKILVSQTCKKFEQFAPELSVGKIYGEQKEFGRQVTVITYQSLINQLTNGTLQPNEYECLILDEAHLMLGEKRTETVGAFPHAIQIGFTATPEYTRKRVGDILETEIHRMNIPEAVHEGMMSSFSSIVARTETDLSGITITGTNNYNEEELAKAVNIVSRNKAAVQLYLQAFKGQRGVSFCVGVAHAEEMAKVFNETGVTAAVVSGKTPHKEVREIFEKFSRGEILMLCNADILITGFDEPQASVCLNLRPTCSRVVAEQRGGRVLRNDDNNPEKHAYIVDFLDSGLENGKLPVLFADVAEGAHIMQRKKLTGRDSGEPKEISPQFSNIHIEGLKVTVKTEEIMQIVREKKTQERRQTEKISLENLKLELQEELQKRGIDPKGKNLLKIYRAIARDKPTWPINPNEYYGSLHQWRSVRDLFGLEKISFKVLREEVQKVRIHSQTMYMRYRKTFKKDLWPVRPDIHYEEWAGWDHFLGIERQVRLSFEDLKRDVRNVHLKSSVEYKRYRVTHRGDWPSQPEVIFKTEWKSWADFLNATPTRRVMPKLTFEELRIAVRKCEITTEKEYHQLAREHPEWPSHPEKYYKGEWPEKWADFLDVTPSRQATPKLSLEALEKEVREVGITSIKEYKKHARTHFDWPSTPEKYYEKQGWKSFPALFGNR